MKAAAISEGGGGGNHRGYRGEVLNEGKKKNCLTFFLLFFLRYQVHNYPLWKSI